MNIEIMRNTLYKAYLEDFYKFCQVGAGKPGRTGCMLAHVISCGLAQHGPNEPGSSAFSLPP